MRACYLQGMWTARLHHVRWQCVQIRSLVAAAALAVVGASGCINGPAVMTEQAEARRLAGELQLSFANANEAANRAVLADTDEASIAAAKESESDSSAAQRGLDQLEQHLRSLGYQDEINSLERFRAKFDECRKLDAEILPLAVENTNLKAQRLSFGEAQESADGFGAAVDAAAAAARSADGELQATRARAAVLAMQVLQSRHIAEANDAAMDQMEQQMAALERRARAAVERLRASSGFGATSELDSAAAALDRFVNVNQQIVQLSRRNTNVRSLALTLGRKRVVAAEAEDQLRILGEALAAHTFQGSR